jgi:hypothetical protein
MSFVDYNALPIQYKGEYITLIEIHWRCCSETFIH